MNAVLLVSYDGTALCGWQIQKNGRTVQGELEGALLRAFGVAARVTGSGRTDAGVHAAGQVCNFALPDTLSIEPGRIADALNAFLPPDIRVLQSARASEAFDACRAAKKKTYRYSVYFSRREHPLLERYAARVGQAPDPARLRACADLLEGEHDFAAFSSTGSSVKTTVRTVYSIALTPWQAAGGGSIGAGGGSVGTGGGSIAAGGGSVGGLHIDVCGGGFLYNMVRILAGALLDCGAGKLPLSAVAAALADGKRDLLGKTMPAKGLTLLGVDYGFGLFGADGFTE